MTNVVQAELNSYFSFQINRYLCHQGPADWVYWLGMLVLLGAMSVMFGQVCKG